MRLQTVALFAPDHELVVHVTCLILDRFCGDHGDRQFRHLRTVALGFTRPSRRPAIQVPELHTQYGSLQRIQSRIDADPLVKVLSRAAMDTQRHQLLGQSTVVRCHDPAVAVPAQVLAREKAEGANLSDTDRKSTRLNSSHRCISYAV